MAKLTNDQINIILDDSLSVTAAAVKAKCSPTTVRKYRKAHESTATMEQIAESYRIVAESEHLIATPAEDSPHDLVTFTNADTLADLDYNTSRPPGENVGKCGYAPTGSGFACGLPADHVHRRIGHVYGDRLERQQEALATSSLD